MSVKTKFFAANHYTFLTIFKLTFKTYYWCSRSFIESLPSLGFTSPAEAEIQSSCVCKVIMNGEIMFSDGNHLSVYGSEKVAIPIVASILEKLVN